MRANARATDRQGGRDARREDWVPVESSALAAVRYRPAPRTLDTAFHTGRIYRYYDLPAEVFAGLLASESKGRYYNARIRDAFHFDRLA